MPLVSVFTPSHDPTYLDQCYSSLKAQTLTAWEWIIVLNGDAYWTPPADDRVSVHVARHLTGRIGALKAFACSLATSPILVELDHDDLLTKSALDVIHTSFQFPDVGLVYSDFAQINADNSPNSDRFADGYGWNYYTDTLIAGSEEYPDIQVIESKPPTPHNVSYIWYAPNHVRAFRRSIYEAVGGYNQDLTVCDDAELMCRMYQCHNQYSAFLHINHPLYLQRIHDNTQRDPEKNALIQTETVRIYDENIQKNAIAWAQRSDLPCYDLGGAHNCPEHYEPIDIALSGTDVLTFLSTLPDDYVGVYRAVDFIEHIATPIPLMNEIYRTLAPGGMFLSLTPSTDGRGAFCDPTHVSFWNELSFRYYCDPEYQKYVPQITSRFRQSRLFTDFPSDWHRSNNIPYVCSNLTKEPQCDSPRSVNS